MESAEAVDFSDNTIEVFPHLVFPSLIALNLASNRLTQPVVINSLITLKELNLSNNQIKRYVSFN